MSPYEALSAAAEFLKPPGKWGKGDYERTRLFKTEPCFCILGAVLKVQGKAYGAEDDDEACIELAKTLYPDEPWPFMVARWNDKPERTQTEVVLALRLAAARIKEAA